MSWFNVGEIGEIGSMMMEFVEIASRAVCCSVWCVNYYLKLKANKIYSYLVGPLIHIPQERYVAATTVRVAVFGSDFCVLVIDSIYDDLRENHSFVPLFVAASSWTAAL